MKIIAILAISLAFLSGTAQELYRARTESFRKSVGRSEHAPFDTATKETARTILLAKDAKEFTIGFPEDGETIYIRYEVSKKESIKDKSDGVEYRSYTGYDEAGYPMVLYISKDETKGMLYYYYTNGTGAFSKSEKMRIKKER